MGNSRWRLETSINLALLNAKKTSSLNQLEIIVSDWGSEIPLRDVLKLVPEAKGRVKFVHIPPDIAKIEQKDSKFPEVIALNAAARRASGEYIGRIDNDTVVGADFFRKFHQLHKISPMGELDLANSFLFVERKSVPYRISRLSLNLNQIDSFITFFKNHFRIESATDWGKEFWWSPVGIMIFHRNIWHACRGYDERLIYWGWMEGDLALRLGQKHEVIEFSKFVGNDFYHLEHYPSLTAYKDRNGPATPRQKNEPVFEGLSYTVNKDHWGLWQKEGITFLDYKLVNTKQCFLMLFNKLFFVPRVILGLLLRKIDQIKMHGSDYISEKVSSLRIFLGKIKSKVFKLIVS
jgi:glycosyltransferase involved in cell wall biosynthesis